MEVIDINKIVDGDLTEDQIKEVEAKLSETSRTQLRELLAIKSQRRAEEERLQKAQDENKAAAEAAQKNREEEEARIAAARKSADQFRLEQILKAETKFFNDYKIPVEEQTTIRDLFHKLDSGKVDPDFIYQDFISAFAARNSGQLLEAQKIKLDMERQAAEAEAQGAAGTGGGGSGDPNPSKFSKETQELAKKSNIPLEAADKIAKEGMHRVIGA